MRASSPPFGSDFIHWCRRDLIGEVVNDHFKSGSKLTNGRMSRSACGRREAQPDVHRSGYIFLITQDGLVPFQPAGGGPGSQSPQAVARESQHVEEYPKNKKLDGYRSPRRMDELRQESKKEYCNLGVENLNQNSLCINPSQR